VGDGTDCCGILSKRSRKNERLLPRLQQYFKNIIQVKVLEGGGGIRRSYFDFRIYLSGLFAYTITPNEIFIPIFGDFEIQLA